MTKAQIREMTLQLLDDTLGLYFNAAFMDNALNRSQEEVQKHLIMAGELYYLKQVQALTVQNQQDYIWPTDLLKINRIEIVTGGVSPTEILREITPITLNQMNRFGQQAGEPANYVLKQDRFSFYPIPETPNQTINLYYSYKIADLTSDSQVPDIPEIYHKVIAAYAARMGKVKDDSDMTNVLQLIAPFEKEMNELAQDRQYQQPRMVKCLDGEYWGGF